MKSLKDIQDMVLNEKGDWKHELCDYTRKQKRRLVVLESAFNAGDLDVGDSLTDCRDELQELAFLIDLNGLMDFYKENYKE